MSALRLVLRAVARFIVIWIVGTLAVLFTSWLLPGMNLNPVNNLGPLGTAAAVAFVVGLANLVIRPLILLLALPLGFIALFVVGFFVNAIILRLVANLLDPAFQIDGWLAAIIGGVVLSLVTSILMSLLNIEDEGSFYEGVVARRLGRQRVELPPNPTRGLVMLEIDGLSYHHIKKALDDGYMPNVKNLIDHHGYVLTRTDCGLPSQTSACQTGILFGDNHDIPAFRWYDKSQNKLFVSGNDAALINSRYSTGNGLLRGGASVNNMMNGDAAISLLTASDLRGGTSDQKKDRARDVYTLLINPNFFMRVIGLVLGEAALEVWQYFRDVVGGVEPRLNRLHKAYPIIRAVTTVFMREVSGYLTIMQIVRGEPAMYTTWPGYDEVAHHSGPWTKHAFGTLRGFDRFIGTVLEVIETKAPRPYEFLLLSDHGQSFGPTFLQRYGFTLKDYILRHMPEGTVIQETTGGDDGSLSVVSVAAELGNVREEGMGGTVGKAAAKQMEKAAIGAAKRTDTTEEGLEGVADVTFCGSGNLAQVYFHAFPNRTTISDLNNAYPGMVDAVVQHEGVGLVVVTDDDGVPIVFGKNGARNLHTDEISGEDPLIPYGDVEVRAWQLRRVADFPATGDLIAISTVYPDGTVAAMEELIGNHGGMGGEQTDSFLLHPADMEVPPTRNSIDLFSILNARRDLPAPVRTVEAKVEAVDDWSGSNLVRGIGQVGTWGALALRSIFLERTAFRTIADNSLMTGPALLLSLAGVLVTSLAGNDFNFNSLGEFLPAFAAAYVIWFIGVAILHGTARVLRGKATFTQTFRVMGFVQTIHILGLLSLIPVIAPLVPIGVTIVSLFAAWLGVSEAHRLRGWRTLILPLLYIVIIIVGTAVMINVLRGLGFALETLAADFGLMP